MEGLLGVLSEIADAVSAAIRLIPSVERGKDIEMGADGTPTSEIDKIAENTVLDYILRNSVPLNVLSEEIGFVDYGFEETLVLDPIDGSNNAAAGVPMFTVSMGVGTSSLKGVHTAYLRNLTTGESYWAEKGKGAFKDGRRIRVRKPDMDKLFLNIYLGSGASERSYGMVRKARTVRDFGCSSLEMVLVAEGVADAYYMDAEHYNRGIRVVDIAASYLILKEAGGSVYDLSGKDLDIRFDLSDRSSFVAVSEPAVFSHFVSCPGDLPGRPVYALTLNPASKDVKSLAERVVKAMEGETLFFDISAAEVLGTEGRPLSEVHPDVVITIGGDGTILRAAQMCDGAVIGINNGGVGFLADIPPDDIETGLERVRRGDYSVTERFKLDTYINGEKVEAALNEAVIHTDTVGKIRQFRIFVDGNLASDVRADGIVISTQVGSTSYAMSLGAPIIDPGVDALVIVPIAPYKLSSRPFIVPAHSSIKVECTLDKGCVIVVDGQADHAVAGGSVIECVRSSSSIRFINLGTDFYTRLHEKLVKDV